MITYTGIIDLLSEARRGLPASTWQRYRDEVRDRYHAHVEELQLNGGIAYAVLDFSDIADRILDDCAPR